MSNTVFTSTIANALKNTLDAIATDKTDGVMSGMLLNDWCNVDSMEDNYVDDLEIGGPGLASEKAEGAEIATGTIKEGYLTRYISRTFALKLIVTEEAIEDNKYKPVISAARRLKRSLAKTADIDATNMLVRATNSAYTGGDGQPLASASHTLPQGGTFSNLMSTPMTVSHAAVTVATSQIRRLPDHAGLTEGYEPKKVVCPVDQWAAWESLLGSSNTPGVFNQINVVNRLKLDLVVNKYWSNTTTNWAIITDAEEGLKFLWRRKPKNNSWVENDQTVMKYSITARWARGWTDPRGLFFSNA